MILGISGKSGSGKSSISKYLEDNYGYMWIDSDKIAKEIREIHINEIIDLVGDSDIVKESKIDSKKLGDILFSNTELLKKYNDFIYSKLKKSIKDLTKKSKKIVIDSMFLPIMEIYNDCDYKILVICDTEKRKQRIINRDNIEEEYFIKRDNNGLNYNCDDFDFVIDNNDDFKLQLEEIMKVLN